MAKAKSSSTTKKSGTATAKKPNLKKTDYNLNYGTLPVDFVRGVQINGKSSNLTVTIKLNFKKDLFTILPSLDNDQVVGDPDLDKSTLDTLQELTNEALKFGVKWRNERKEAKEENSDPDQLEIGF